MEFKWDQFTAFRLVLPLVLGIAAAVYCPFFTEIGQKILLLSILIPLLGFVLLQIIKVPTFSFWRLGSGILMFLFLFFFGIWNTLEQNEINQPAHFSHFIEKEGQLLVQLTEPIISKANSYKTTVKVLEVLQGKEVNSTIGQAILYFAKNDSTIAPPLLYGDVLMVKDNFAQISPPPNPEQFDYQRYLRFQNIFHQAYLQEKDWQKIGVNQGNRIMAQVFELRACLLSILKEKVPGAEESAVAAALLLGDKQLLQTEVQAIYQDTGAMHVLAVSGLHVGIVMMILGFVFSFVNRFKYGANIHLLLMLLGIWLFALLTGMAPSVFRSSVTFSLIAIGKHSNRNVSSLNVVAASANFLLFFNPLLLFQVGFQLSYMAVIAILYLYPKFTDPFQIENKYLNSIWQVSAVSIAATIGTLPLTLHYFNQFPVYFLLSNLLVAPAAYLIIGFGIATFVFSPIPYLGDLVGNILYGLIWLLNKLLSLIQELPFSVAEGIYFPNIEMWLAYFMMLFILLFMRLKSPKMISLSLLCLCLLFGNQAYRKKEAYQKGAFSIYQIKKQTAIEFKPKQSDSTILFGSQNFRDDPKLYDYNVKPFHLQSGITAIDWIDKSKYSRNDLAVNWPFIQFEDKRMLLIDEAWKVEKAIDSCGLTLDKMDLDYLILSNNQFVPLKELLGLFNFKRVIIDDSNSYSKIKYWTKLLDKQGISYYCTKANGAFIENL